jgi:hypothetical protein
MDEPFIGFINKQTGQRIVQPFENETRYNRLTKDEEDSNLKSWVKIIDIVTSDGDYNFIAPPVFQEFFSIKPFTDNETQAIMWVNNSIRNTINSRDDDTFNIWITSKWAQFYIQRSGYSHFLEICKYGTPQMLQALQAMGKVDLVDCCQEGLQLAKEHNNQPVVKLLSKDMKMWFEHYLPPHVVQDIKKQIMTMKWKYYGNEQWLSPAEKNKLMSYLDRKGVSSDNIKTIMKNFA